MSFPSAYITKEIYNKDCKDENWILSPRFYTVKI